MEKQKKYESPGIEIMNLELESDILVMSGEDSVIDFED